MAASGRRPASGSRNERSFRNAPWAALVLLCLGGCTGAGSLFERPHVGFRGVEVADVGFGGLTARFQLIVENPNAIGIDVAQLGYRLTVDGHLLAEGSSAAGLHVPAEGAGELTVPVGVSFAELGPSLDALLARKQVPFGLHVELGFGMPTGVRTVPIEASGMLPLPQPPRVELAHVELGELTVSRASLDVALAFTNDNPFAVPLGALRYLVTVEDEPISSGTLAALELAPHAGKTVHLSARIDLLSVAAQLVGALSSRTARIGLDGELALGAINLPLHLRAALR